MIKNNLFNWIKKIKIGIKLNEKIAVPIIDLSGKIHLRSKENVSIKKGRSEKECQAGNQYAQGETEEC
jgi:hypothetical protein